MDLTIAHRFCGPPESGNGGWVSGAVAARVPTTARLPAVMVRLASPPPLDRLLTLTAAPSDDGTIGVHLLDRDHLVASAMPAAELDDELSAPPSMEDAQAAELRYEGLTDHPFPTCFVCGTGREPGDGLCLRPGPLDDGTGRYAATWVPGETSGPFVWAALDCPGGWSAGIAGRPMVLGTMTARIHTLPTPGERHVILAWQRGAQGRKHLSGSALFSGSGEVLARAEATWIAVDPASVRPREHQ